MIKSSHWNLNGVGFAIVFACLGVPAAGHAGLVAAWGANEAGQIHLPNGVTNIRAIAAGFDHSVGLRSDGTLVAWGLSNFGSVNIPPGLSNITAISAGGYHNLALNTDGRVVGWGDNQFGQSRVPANLTNIVALAAGGYYNLALKDDGTVVAWGRSYYGETNVPSGLSNVRAIAAGGSHSLALKADGTVVAWGYESYTNVPTGLANVVAIAAGGEHSLALKADGTVVAWGSNRFSESDVPTNLANVVAISTRSSHNLALRADGSVVAWGFNSQSQTAVPSNLPRATAIAAGRAHSLALVAEGPVQISQQPQSQSRLYTSNVTFSVVATGREAIGYQWLFNGSPISPNTRVSGTTNAILNISNAQFTDIGAYVVVVSNAFSSVASSSATLDVISPPFITSKSPDQTVGAGTFVTLSVSASGTPPLSYQWKLNGTNLLGRTFSSLFLSDAQPEHSGIYSLIVSNVHDTTSTNITLTVTNTAPYFTEQPSIRTSNLRTTLTSPVPIGGSVALTVSARGSLPLSYQWRFNGVDIPGGTNATLPLNQLSYEQTGFYSVEVGNVFGSTNSIKLFLNVAQVLIAGTPFAGNTNMPSALSNVVAVAAGGSHVMALRSDGTVRTWLANAGYIFDQAYSVTNVPASVTNVIAIAAGRSHCLALRSNGTVVAWGATSSGQTNVPTGLSNVVAIAAGAFRGYAIKADGTVTGWGNQPAVPLGLSNVVAVAAGPSQNLALKRDGTVIAWATSSTSLASVPSGLSNVIAIAAGSAENRALRQDGTVVAWTSAAGFTFVLDGQQPLSNTVAIAVGSGVSMLLKQDGTIRSSELEKLGLPVSTNISAIAAGGVQAGFGVMMVGNGSPAITLQPHSQIVQRSNTVQLHARAAGGQPMNYQWQLENQNLPGATNASLLITNAQGKDTGGYRMIVSNPLGAATSRIAALTIPYNTNLAAALNTNNWQWLKDDFTTNWFAQIRETHDGDVAAQSGAIGNNQRSTLVTSITGPGMLSFWWKVSSEEGFDFLRFYLNSTTVPRASISGETDWQRMTIAIPPGQSQTLRWIYSKDSTVSAGRDAGWLDEVVFTPDPPVITLQPTPPNTTAAMGSNVTIRVTATGLGPLSYQWLKNSAALSGATQSSFTLTNLTRRNSGTYAVRVANAGGSTLSSNTTLVVRVPQRLQAPRRLADGSLLVTSGDADGGALLPEDLVALEVQASTNLVNWATVTGVPALTNGSLVLHDPGSTNFPVRFYRMVEH